MGLADGILMPSTVVIVGEEKLVLLLLEKVPEEEDEDSFTIEDEGVVVEGVEGGVLLFADVFGSRVEGSVEDENECIF